MRSKLARRNLALIDEAWGDLVRLVAVLLQLFLELLGFAVPDFYWVNAVICLLKLDRSVTNVLACGVNRSVIDGQFQTRNGKGAYRPFLSRL